MIPLPYYTPLFFYTLVFLVFFVFIKIQTKAVAIQINNKKEYLSLLLLLVLSLYMGLRPVSGMYFGDMGNYGAIFESYAYGEIADYSRGDILWTFFMKFSSNIMSVQIFFLLCAFLYITPLYIACKIWFGVNKYIPFLMFIASFSFWAYGTNGVRNGIATSIFVMAISLRKNKYLKYIYIIICYFIHASLIIPITAYIFTLFHKNPKHYLWGWLVAIPLSLALGGFWEGFFGTLGFGGKRLSYLSDSQYADAFSSTGFRWDFLLYSSSAVFMGYNYILKKKFKDKIYHQIFNIYVTTNAFWILVIRASFSNRFAYLSWFLMAAVIFYPFFKKKIFRSQKKVLVISILIYFGFTFFMNMLLS